MASLRLSVAVLEAGTASDRWLNTLLRINWLGVLALLGGVIMALFANRLCERIAPDRPERALFYRIMGVALAFSGVLLLIK